MAVAKASYDSINIANLTREDLAAFRPPEYEFPYVVSRNPLYLGEETLDWFRGWLLETEVDKVLPPKVFERLLRTNVPLFNCYSHPITALGQWGFQWITKFLAYFVIMDDITAGPNMGKDPKTVLSVLLDANLIMLWSFPDDRQLLENVKTFVHWGTSGKGYEEKMSKIEDLLTEARSNPGKAYTREIITVCKCFLELWMDALKRSAPGSMLLMAHATQHWYLGVFQEAEARKKEMSLNVIELQEYIEVRGRSGALWPLVASREIASGFRTPNHWFESPSMLRVRLAASDLISWDNDLLSFAKEILVEKDVTGNMLAAISKCKSVNFEKAVEILHKMMDERIVDLEAAFADLEKSTPPELMPNFHIYVEAIRDMLVGSHIWCMVSPRYSEY